MKREKEREIGCGERGGEISCYFPDLLLQTTIGAHGIKGKGFVHRKQILNFKFIISISRNMIIFDFDYYLQFFLSISLNSSVFISI